MVAEAQKEAVDTDLVVSTCLLHDIGAIVKFDFEGDSYGFYTEQEVDHWITVRNNIRALYGFDEYTATSAILQELHLDRVYTMFMQIGSGRLEKILSEGSREAQIIQYADTRVGPLSILSVEERIAEARVRYAPHADTLTWFNEVEKHRELSLQLEKQLLDQTGLVGRDINDTAAESIIKELWDYEIA